NPEYYISNAWLTQLENSDSVPSVYKLFSLSIIYHIKFSDLLRTFGVDLDRIGKYQMEIPPAATCPAEFEIADAARPVSFPIRFDPYANLSKTNLLSRMVETWGEIPVAALQHLDLGHQNYGYIGTEDLTLFPLIRPGSMVQIDPQVRKVQVNKWRTE